MSKKDDDAYLEEIGRIEPTVGAIDHDAAIASIAISLKRIADTLKHIDTILEVALSGGWG